MSYFDFFKYINDDKINTIFELGSRDLLDTVKIVDYFKGSSIYAFECNPDALIECDKHYNTFSEEHKNNIHLVKNAVSIYNGPIAFYPFDLQKYNNMGASSLLKIDFSLRNKDDPDYNLPNPQKKIIVDGVRLDTFMDTNNIKLIDLLCIDLQGYELNAIKSLGDKVKQVKYIITEASISSTYSDGTKFIDLDEYLNKYNFKYVCSNKFGFNYPDINLNGFSEFDVLYKRFD